MTSWSILSKQTALTNQAHQQQAYDDLLAAIDGETNPTEDYTVRINGLVVDLLPAGTDYRQTLTDR